MPPRHRHGTTLANLTDLDGDHVILARDSNDALRLILRDADSEWECWVRLDDVTAGWLEFALRRERLSRTAATPTQPSEATGPA